MPAPYTAVPDPQTITVRVPMILGRRGGRKALIAPDGSPTFARARTRVDNALVKAIARAFRWRRLIEMGTYTSLQEIAEAETINASYIGRVLRLTLLAPDIVETILDGRESPSLVLGALTKPFPMDWNAQRRRFT